MVRPVPVTYCRPEPPCVVTDIPKRDIRRKNFFQAQGTIYTATLRGHVKKISISFPRHNYLVPTT